MTHLTTLLFIKLGGKNICNRLNQSNINLENIVFEIFFQFAIRYMNFTLK